MPSRVARQLVAQGMTSLMSQHIRRRVSSQEDHLIAIRVALPQSEGVLARRVRQPINRDDRKLNLGKGLRGAFGRKLKEKNPARDWSVGAGREKWEQAEEYHGNQGFHIPKMDR